MKGRTTPGIEMFVGIGVLIVAWRILPAPDWHPLSKLFSGFLAVTGAALLISSIKHSARRVAPLWQGLAGRLIAVGALWIGIAVVGHHYGTPHLLFEYPVRREGVCLYLGWRGWIAVLTATQSSPAACEAIKFL